MSTQWRHGLTAPRYAPLLGAVIGAFGGVVYWLGAQIWPASVAVVLSMLATVFLSAGIDSPAGKGARAAVGGRLGLSAASLSFALPPNFALGLIMVAGQASSCALGVSVIAPPARGATTPTSHGDVAIALAIGFAPAALIGIPGLIGLVSAIVARAGFVAYARRRRPSMTGAGLGMTRQLTEICFYLGVLGSWSYI
jgi:adenosylcobinamide-GDP ribazoletransferase